MLAQTFQQNGQALPRRIYRVFAGLPRLILLKANQAAAVRGNTIGNKRGHIFRFLSVTPGPTLSEALEVLMHVSVAQFSRSPHFFSTADELRPPGHSCTPAFPAHPEPGRSTRPFRPGDRRVFFLVVRLAHRLAALAPRYWPRLSQAPASVAATPLYPSSAIIVTRPRGGFDLLLSSVGPSAPLPSGAFPTHKKHPRKSSCVFESPRFCAAQSTR